MGDTRGTVASWRLSERSTPADVEERLLAAGLRIVEGDYLIDGMVLTAAPPAADVVARRVAAFDEFLAAVELQYEVFDLPAARRRSAEGLSASWEIEHRGDVWALYAAWIDGRIAGAGAAYFSPRGFLMAGGATAHWARGRGAYRALVRARWDDAAARGTPALVVQAGAMSAPVLRKLGFERRLPSSRERSLYGVTAVKEICLRCGAEMEWRQSTWQCPKCRFKLGCCEGEAGDCRDPG